MNEAVASDTATPDADALALAVADGSRAALARAITLIESTRADHADAAQTLLNALLPRTGNSIRIGITGPPGVGKSTTIDQLGTNLTAAGHRLAVLAVDPSSARSGGAILGDKTRMARLATDANAFIRPSPSAGTLGGVAARTAETILLCEAAGFDVIIVETVGVGQSEAMVADMVDVFLVLAQPGAGDDLQGLKRGVLECADIVAVNKSDGDLADAAARAAADFEAAFHIITPAQADWRPPVVRISALENTGLDLLWSQIEQFRAMMTASDAFEDKRRAQRVGRMHRLLRERVLAQMLGRPAVRELIAGLEDAVRSGTQTPERAVDQVIEQAVGAA